MWERISAKARGLYNKRRKRCNQQGGWERESEPSRHHSMHHYVLHDVWSGNHILRVIIYEIPSSLGHPNDAVFCVVRDSQTARDWVKTIPRLVGRPLACLPRTHAARCGEADAGNEASRDDMGGLLGQRCVILRKPELVCDSSHYKHINCSSLFAQSLSASTSNPNFQSPPSAPSNLQSLSNRPQPKFPKLQLPITLQPSPTSQLQHPVPSTQRQSHLRFASQTQPQFHPPAPPISHFQHSILVHAPEHWHTVQTAHQHTWTRARFQQFGSYVRESCLR